MVQMVSGLQMTDVELEARVGALEENGGGSTENGKNLFLKTEGIDVLLSK